jgi:hypothetical protein
LLSELTPTLTLESDKRAMQHAVSSDKLDLFFGLLVSNETDGLEFSLMEFHKRATWMCEAFWTV